MRKLAEKLGMTQEGVRREAVWTDGAYHDIVEYGLLAREWRG
jgi:RimJ/RimL family protein N-acetyltransferase